MQYTYHCQHQAESFANTILPVPRDYPVKSGLPAGFAADFDALCSLMKKIYMDMAAQPEAYGLILLDINNNDHNLARDSYRTVHRLVDALNAAFLCGNVADHCLTADAGLFKDAIKKNPSVPKYGTIFAKLIEFGFAFTNFNGSAIEKKVESFTIKYPDNPLIIDTIKTYCDCWHELDRFARNRDKPRVDLIKLTPQDFHHHFYRFDYKITADLEQLPILTWVSDDADYRGYSPEQKKFSIAFYNESLKYKNIKFDGEYHYKAKRVARITQVNYNALSKPDYRISIKLANPDKYMDVIAAMPGSVKDRFDKDYCAHCDFQGATAEKCKFRLHWTYAGTPREGCAYQCFYMDDFDEARVQDYWKLLELEYALAK
jgi:hypothetical protein